MTDAARVRFSALVREDPVPEVRAEAARARGVVGEPAKSVAPLVEALDDPNVEVRRAATLALGRIDSPSAVEALVGVLTEHPELWREYRRRWRPPAATTSKTACCRFSTPSRARCAAAPYE